MRNSASKGFEGTPKWSIAHVPGNHVPDAKRVAKPEAGLFSGSVREVGRKLPKTSFEG
jgi:hypothetical protein